MLAASRREVVLSAALAGAALGLDKSVAMEAPALRTPDPKPGYRRYKVGSAECTALYDGIWEKVHDPKYFGNAPAAQVRKGLAEAGLTTAFVPIPVTMFVIGLNGTLVLCDAGGVNQAQAFTSNSVAPISPGPDLPRSQKTVRAVHSQRCKVSNCRSHDMRVQ